MQRLFPPPPGDVDPAEEYAADLRPARPRRPWVLVGMVTSIDGATAVRGRSSGLGGRGDRLVFRAVRATADVILAGAGTVRVEHYGPVRLDEEARASRARGGRDELPRLAVVTERLDLDFNAAVFSEGRPLVVTSEASDATRRARAAEVAEVIVTPGPRVDLAFLLAELVRRGHRVVLSEGGPTLNGALAALGVVDEVCLTVAGRLAGGGSPRILDGAPAFEPPRPMELRRVLTDGSDLFLRYAVDGD